MKTLITGATGLVGFNVAQALLAQKRELRAAVRDVEAARKVLPAEVELARADITNAEEIANAMVGCQRVFHCAGLPEQWLDKPKRFQDINVQGTQNLVDAALAHKVERFVYTSTIDVFEADKGAAYDESTLDFSPKGTFYERSKQDADKIVSKAQQQGLPAIFIHPAAVYGPGPSASPGLNEFLRDLSRGNVPSLLPGGMPVVHASDLSDGFLLAEEQEPGSRYILADRYYSLQEIAGLVAAHCEGAKKNTNDLAKLACWICLFLWGRFGESPQETSTHPQRAALFFALAGQTRQHQGSDRARVGTKNLRKWNTRISPLYRCLLIA